MYETYKTTTQKIKTASACRRYLKYQKCRKCGATRTQLTTTDKTHNYSGYTVTKSATCTATGTKKYTCKDCGYYYTASISKLGHNYEDVGISTTKNATADVCKTTKVKEKCSRCANIRYTTTSTDKTHSYTVSILKEVTCIDIGKFEYTCGDCGYSYVTTLQPLGHSYQESTKVVPIGTKNICTRIVQNKLCDRCTDALTSVVSTNGTHKFNSTGICTDCGYDNIIGESNNQEIFDPTSKEQCMKLQQKLYDLGYYTSTIDGLMGKNTRNAINALLADQGIDRQISSTSDWTDVTSAIYNFSLSVTETKSQARERLFVQKSAEIKEIINDETIILTAEQEAIFDEIISTFLICDTNYSQASRDNGFNAYKNDTVSIDGVYSFDCSSWSSLVVSQAIGIACVREDGKTSYSTLGFLKDKVNFVHEDYTKTGIDVDSLQKGQLILCIDNDADNHIMVYAGNGMIVHSNSTHDGVTMNELSPDDGYTAKFLSTDAGVFENIYVLTPSPEPKE